MEEIPLFDIPTLTLTDNAFFCEICMETTHDFTELYCHHKMCSQCLVKIYFSELDFCCPFCRVKIESKLNKLEEIIQVAKYMKFMKLFFQNNEKMRQNELMSFFLFLKYAIIYKTLKDGYVQSCSFLIKNVKETAILSVVFFFARLCYRKFKN